MYKCFFTKWFLKGMCFLSAAHPVALVLDLRRVEPLYCGSIGQADTKHRINQFVHPADNTHTLHSHKAVR